MRSLHRALATSVAALSFAVAGIAGAGSALATPEDGKGCVGTPDLPATYVCVISVTPENVVPGTTVTNVPVTVPRLCYFLDCTEPRTVDVPVPGVTPRTGVVATLWYRGQYIPINVGTGDATALLYSAIDLATGTVNGAVGTANQTVAYAATLAGGAAGTAYALATSTAAAAVATVNSTVANALTTVNALRATVDQEVAKAVATVNAAVANVNTTINNTVATANREVAKALATAGAAVDNAIVVVNREIANAVATANAVVAAANREVAKALVTVDQAIDYAYAEALAAVRFVEDTVNGLPTIDELLTLVWQTIADALAPYEDDIDRAVERIQEILNDPGYYIDRLLNNPNVQRVLEIVDNLEIPCVDYACWS